jgi:hypothetical protein
VRRAVFAVGLLIGSGGCGPSDSQPAVTVEIAEPEASWDSQLAAVREGRSTEIRLSGENVDSLRFRELAIGCAGLTTLALDRADVRDEDLEPLRSLPNLRWLKLPGPIGDAGIESIAACRDLEILNLPGAAFTDQGLVRLKTLDRLSLLRFGSPGVTDRGLEQLRSLPRLTALHLIGVPITDAGLKTVAGIESLESFYLDGGSVTEKGLRDLLAERPDLHFHKDQYHLPGDPNADVHD